MPVVVMMVPVVRSRTVNLLVVVVSLVGVAETHGGVGPSGDDGAGDGGFASHDCRSEMEVGGLFMYKPAGCCSRFLRENW